MMPLYDIPIGAIWMDSEGGQFGLIVRDVSFPTGKILIHQFATTGWLGFPRWVHFRVLTGYTLVKE